AEHVHLAVNLAAPDHDLEALLGVVALELEDLGLVAAFHAALINTDRDRRAAGGELKAHGARRRAAKRSEWQRKEQQTGERPGHEGFSERLSCNWGMQGFSLRQAAMEEAWRNLAALNAVRFRIRHRKTPAQTKCTRLRRTANQLGSRFITSCR